MEDFDFLITCIESGCFSLVERTLETLAWMVAKVSIFALTAVVVVVVVVVIVVTICLLMDC